MTREQRIAEIDYALRDIAEVIAIWRDVKDASDPYMVKLHREWDALLDEKAAL